MSSLFGVVVSLLFVVVVSLLLLFVISPLSGVVSPLLLVAFSFDMVTFSESTYIRIILQKGQAYELLGMCQAFKSNASQFFFISALVSTLCPLSNSVIYVSLELIKDKALAKEKVGHFFLFLDCLKDKLSKTSVKHSVISSISVC